MLKTLLLIGSGGFAGSISRYLLASYVDKQLNSLFPYGTFTVNVIGCLILGMIYSLAEKNQIVTAEMRFLLATGFCGSFTTFSTFSYDNQLLFQQQQWGQLSLYIVGSVLVGLLATFGGIALGRVI